ncbi:hypothetical protein D9757_004714 [Collybiopsis confluens]|uniref:Transmembrane protein n=1 Tax=Collybiopsis confluens TaxID=2823264 RepID=A0A8H5HS37_9AGAR|nr:hypothetical protein D9757_004714 [Collybiopsis confluens]
MFPATTMTTTTHERESRPFLLTVIVARTLSCVGYGVSIFAIGIIWLLPAVKPATPALATSKRKPTNYRRRSAPPALNPPPSVLGGKPSPRHRHVYFADSPTILIAPGLPFPKRTDLFQDSLDAVSVDASARSSSSTLVATSQCNDPSPKSDPTESDRSSCSSRRISAKKIPTWNRKTSDKKSSGNAVPGAEAVHSDETPTEYRNKDRGRISSLNFPWTASRTKSSPETNMESVSSSSFSLQPTLPLRSSTTPDVLAFVYPPQRRVSAPGRERTQPYAYPYFALPPDMRTTLPTPAKVADSSQESSERPVSDDLLEARRRHIAAAQASLGLGSRRSPQPRAMTEGVV